MSDVKCPCYVCCNLCKDHNADPLYFSFIPWKNICSKCVDLASLGVYTHDIGVSRFFKYMSQLEKMRAHEQEHQRLSASTNAFTSKYPEAPCPQCNRNNDKGNPKVKQCWNCELPLS